MEEFFMLNFFEQTFKKIIQKKMTFNKELEIDYIIHNDTNMKKWQF